MEVAAPPLGKVVPDLASQQDQQRENQRAENDERDSFPPDGLGVLTRGPWYLGAAEDVDQDARKETSRRDTRENHDPALVLALERSADHLVNRRRFLHDLLVELLGAKVTPPEIIKLVALDLTGNLLEPVAVGESQEVPLDLEDLVGEAAEAT